MLRLSGFDSELCAGADDLLRHVDDTGTHMRPSSCLGSCRWSLPPCNLVKNSRRPPFSLGGRSSITSARASAGVTDGVQRQERQPRCPTVPQREACPVQEAPSRGSSADLRSGLRQRAGGGRFRRGVGVALGRGGWSG
jgi:hypothetical protein